MKNKPKIKQYIALILACGLIIFGCALTFCGFIPTAKTIAISHIAISKGVEVIKVFLKNSKK